MPPDAELFQRYSDLLEGDTADLAPLAERLDSLYAAMQPPAHLEQAIERAVHARAAEQPVAIYTQPVRRWWNRGDAPTGGQPSMKRRQIQTLAACAAAFVVVALMAALLHGFGVGISHPAGPGPGPNNGQDEQRFYQLGGLYTVVQVSCPQEEPSCDLSKGMKGTLSMLSSRLARTFNVSFITVRQNGPDSILIELPGVKSEAQLAPLLNRGAVAFLETGQIFVPVGTQVSVCTKTCLPGQYKAVLTGADVDPNSVSAALDSQNEQPVVTFAFNAKARTLFADYTRTHMGQLFTVTLDSTVIESAVIQAEIDGSTQITGLATLDVARQFALYLQHGALPLQLLVQTLTIVAPGSQPNSVSCPPSTPVPTVPTPTATVRPPNQATPTATAFSASQPTPTASPTTALSSIPPTPTAFPGGELCPSPTPMSGQTPTPGPTPPPTPTATAHP